MARAILLRQSQTAEMNLGSQMSRAIPQKILLPRVPRMN